MKTLGPAFASTAAQKQPRLASSVFALSLPSTLQVMGMNTKDVASGMLKSFVTVSVVILRPREGGAMWCEGGGREAGKGQEGVRATALLLLHS